MVLGGKYIDVSQKNQLSHKEIKMRLRIRFTISAVIILFCMALSFPLQGSARAGNQTGLPKNPVYQPATPLSADQDPSSKSSKRPIKFDGGGRIDRIDKVDIVINDRLFSLAPDIHYYSESGKRISSGPFKEGKVVRFELNKKIEIISLWLNLPPDSEPCE
jgi:hypothetical protein